MWNSAKVLDVSWFLVARVERDDWNNWNFGTLGTRLAPTLNVEPLNIELP